MQGWVVGIDLGGTKIDFGLVNPQDQIVLRRRVATEAQGGAQPVIERIAQNIADRHDHIRHRCPDSRQQLARSPRNARQLARPLNRRA